MKTSEINFKIELDNQNIPDKISWTATDKPTKGLDEAKAISIAIWDGAKNGTLRIDLWTKDMPVMEMKRFYIECVAGLADSLANATGDDVMASEMEATCKKLVDMLKEQEKQQGV